MRKSLIGAVVAGVLVAGGVATATASASRQDDSPRTPLAVASTAITEAQARQIAEAVVLNGTVTEIELRAEGWKVHLTAPDGRYEVTIDATTGEIVKFEGPAPSGSPSPSPSGTHDGNRDDDDNDGDRGRGRGSDDGPGDDHGGRSGHDDDDDDGSGRGRGRGGDDD